MTTEELVIAILFILILLGDLALMFFISKTKYLEERITHAEIRINSVFKRMKAEDKAIEELGLRIDSASDIIFNIKNDCDDLTQKCEKTQWDVLKLKNDVDRIKIGEKHELH